MYLLDTNIFLELMLEQENADQVEHLITRESNELLYLTDFSLHSIGIILFRESKPELFEQFSNDLLSAKNIRLIGLNKVDTNRIVEVHKIYNLDFDDAYQYTSAEKYNLRIVSYDKDFDKTGSGRITPVDVLEPSSSRKNNQ